jgi:hypothetical protein
VVELAQALAAACRQGVGEISRPLVPWGLPESGSCVRVRTRRYSLPNSDNPNLHPIMNEMTDQTAPMIVAIMSLAGDQHNKLPS